MYRAKEKHKYSFGIYFALIVYLVCTTVGVILPLKFPRISSDEISSFFKAGLCKHEDFLNVFLNICASDFKYCCLALVFAVSTYTSFFPLVVLGYNGFCTGFSAAVLSRIVSRSSMCALSVMLLTRNIFCIPVYVVLFFLCVRCSHKMTDSSAPGRERLREYASFALSVAVMFTVLCFFDLLQSVLWIAARGFVKI